MPSNPPTTAPAIHMESVSVAVGVVAAAAVVSSVVTDVAVVCSSAVTVLIIR